MGKAVVLRADGAKRAFLSGPLQLKSGVTLVVDSMVTLFGSRDPRVYDVTPGACGVLAQSGRGCFALIRAERLITPASWVRERLMGEGGRRSSTAVCRGGSWRSRHALARLHKIVRV